MNVIEFGKMLDSRDRPLMRAVEKKYGEQTYIKVLEVADVYLLDKVDPDLLRERLSRLPPEVREKVEKALPREHRIEPPKNRGHAEALRYAMEASRGFFETRRAILKALL